MVVSLREYKQAWEFGSQAFLYVADPSDVVNLLRYIQVSQEQPDGTRYESVMVKCTTTGIAEVWASTVKRPYVDDPYERIYKE